MSEEKKPALCSIEGCGEEVCDYDWGPSPYCACHENDYGSEWRWCWQGACPRPVPATGDVPFCSLHGGQDYTPRTREEGESSATTSSPCIVCGVPISGSTRDAEPWAFEGERGRREGKAHTGCMSFVEERRQG